MKNILKGFFTKKEVVAQKTLLETVEQNGQGLSIVGAAGTGKTMAIRELVAEAKGRGDKVFIFDNKDAAFDVDAKLVAFLSAEPPVGRTLFVFDEFGYTGALEAIKPLIVNARQYKATIAIAFQDALQIRKVYGHDISGIIDPLNTSLVFNCGINSETTYFFAARVGVVEAKLKQLPPLTGYLGGLVHKNAEMRTAIATRLHTVKIVAV